MKGDLLLVHGAWPLSSRKTAVDNGRNQTVALEGIRCCLCIGYSVRRKLVSPSTPNSDGAVRYPDNGDR